MKKLIYFTCALAFLICASFTSGSGLPDTEVWLFEFEIKADQLTSFDKYTVGDGWNISKHKGYDSQPAFGDGGLLWTSERDSGQTEIFRYDLKTKQTTQLTHTGVSEYSPTFAPDGKNISCVVVERDSTQRLWLYDRTTFKSQVMMPTVSKIGYHCWTDSNTVFTFLLTEPFSLARCEVSTGKTVTIANNIGRSMAAQHTMKFNRLFYTTKDTSGEATIRAYDLDSKQKVPQFGIPCKEGSEDFALYKRTFFMASGTKLYYWDTSSQNNSWIKFADLSSSGLENITRIAISPDGKYISVVDNQLK